MNNNYVICHQLSTTNTSLGVLCSSAILKASTNPRLMLVHSVAFSLCAIKETPNWGVLQYRRRVKTCFPMLHTASYSPSVYFYSQPQPPDIRQTTFIFCCKRFIFIRFASMSYLQNFLDMILVCDDSDMPSDPLTLC